MDSFLRLFLFSILTLPSRSLFRVRRDATPKGIGRIVTLLPEQWRLQRSADLSFTSPASLHFARRLPKQQSHGTQSLFFSVVVANILFILIDACPVLIDQRQESITKVLDEIKKIMELLETTQDPKKKNFLQQSLERRTNDLHLMSSESQIIPSFETVRIFDPFDFHAAL
jgi:hypothetical protein